MARIVLDQLVKRYTPSTAAVDNVDLDVADGEFLVLVGPSGCGKSTLLRMIAGLETVTGGRILIGERDVTHVQPRDRDIAMVFQNYALYPHMSVRQNIGYALKVRRVPKQEIAARVATVAGVLGLGELLDRKPSALSGGQRQRVAMGRAIVREPAAFLMDEPLSNLDAKLRVSMRAELAQLHHRLGSTMIYVTHDQVEAMTLGQRVAVLDHGRLLQVDTPQNLYDSPRNLFVATFIGSPAMNVLNGHVSGGVLEVAGIRVALAAGRRPARDGAVIVGLRPHAFEAAAHADPELPTIEVVPEVVEGLGSETNVIFMLRSPKVDLLAAVATDDDEPLIAADGAALTASIDPHSGAEVGEPLRLSINPSALYFFDREDGRNLLHDASVSAV